MLRSLSPNTGGREAHGSGEVATRPRVAGRRQPALRGHRRGGRAEPCGRAADGRGSLAELHRRRRGHRSLQRGTQRLIYSACCTVAARLCTRPRCALRVMARPCPRLCLLPRLPWDSSEQDLKCCREGKNHTGKSRVYGEASEGGVRESDKPREQTGGLAVIGLPDTVQACLFDLDGVLTRTATVHAAAWKEMFDGYLRERAARTGEEFVPFDPIADYTRYVDGMPRYAGVRSFLTARGIELPEGESGDPPSAETVRGLGNRKNELVLRLIREEGVEVYDGSVRYLEAARGAGLRRAVVSSSANTRDVLVTAGIEGYFEARIDGVVAEREGLKGKPAPDTFLAGAQALGVAPGEAAVFEDALAGVEAGRAGDFACVVGVDRVGQAEALREHGASIVVSDLSELLEDR